MLNGNVVKFIYYKYVLIVKYLFYHYFKMSIFKYEDINIKNINYDKPEKKGTYYYSSINYDKKPLLILTPKMKSMNNKDGILRNSNIDCESITNDFNFYDFFLKIEDRNVKETFRNNKEWFGKEIPLELIDDMYKRTIKPVKKDNKPSFTFKLPIIKNKVQCHIYDQNKMIIDIDKLDKDSEIIFVIHIRGLKFLKQHYYCDCYVSQIKIISSKIERFNILDECLIEDDNNEKEDIDIIDEEILNEINIKKEKEKEKNVLKKNLELQMLELKKQLDNL